MVIDHALGVSRGTRGVIEGDGIPFVTGQKVPRIQRVQRIEIYRALIDQVLVTVLTQQFAVCVGCVINMDDLGLNRHLRQRLFRNWPKFLVHDDHAGFTMLENERDGGGIQTNIDGVQHRSRHGHRIMRFEHLRDIGTDDGYGIAALNAPGPQGRGNINAAIKDLAPGQGPVAVAYGGFIAIDHGGTAQHGYRRQRHKIGWISIQILIVNSHIKVRR